jgi:hypothetical protein
MQVAFRITGLSNRDTTREEKIEFAKIIAFKLRCPEKSFHTSARLNVVRIVSHKKSLADLLAAFPEMDFVARTIEAHEISLNGLVTFKLATMGAE